VSGIVGTKIIIALKNICLKENRSFQEINAVTTPLIGPEKVYLPPLHIQLGLLKNSVKQCIKTALDLCI
jgi:hypothetical protein